MSTAAGSWSDLPADIVNLIIDSLDRIIDFIYFGAVCRSWGLVQTNRRCVFNRLLRDRPQIPWLLVSSTEKPGSCYLYSIIENKINFQISLPQVAEGCHFVGSSEGFLFTVDQHGDMHGFNPVTEVRFSLPSTATQPNIGGVSHNPAYYYHWNFGAADPQYARLNLHHMRHFFYTKAIVSPSIDTVVVIQSGDLKEISFFRVGDTSWTAVSPWTLQYISDIIFHKGHLHAIDIKGTLYIFDLANPLYRPFISPAGPLQGTESARLRRFLVESPDGEDLFFLFEDLELHEDDNKHKTKKFKVFKLNKNNFVWNEVRSLGEIALFLGLNYSQSFSTRQFPGLKRNGIYLTDIYFTDGYGEPYNDHPDSVGDTIVFSLEDGSIERLKSKDNDCLKCHYPPPIWFTPVLR